MTQPDIEPLFPWIEANQGTLSIVAIVLAILLAVFEHVRLRLDSAQQQRVLVNIVQRQIAALAAEVGDWGDIPAEARESVGLPPTRAAAYRQTAAGLEVLQAAATIFPNVLVFVAKARTALLDMAHELDKFEDEPAAEQEFAAGLAESIKKRGRRAL